MLRHRLAALFEPRSLLVLSSRAVPVMLNPPPALQKSITVVEVQAGGPITLPQRLDGLENGERPDLALLCVSDTRLPEALDALQGCRPRALMLLTADVPSADPAADHKLCQTWARRNGCLLVGPRAFGIQRPGAGLNLTHMPELAQAGRVALVSQSGSIAAAVLDWAAEIGLGFSTVVSPGDDAGERMANILDYLATDPATDSIVLHLEQLTSLRELASALRAAAGVKPVVVLKSGRARQGPDSPQDAIFNALLRRVGAVRVPYFVQLFSAIKALGNPQRPRGRRIALLSNGAGTSQLALDVMGANSAVFRAELSRMSVLELTKLLEPGAEVTNPVITRAPLSAEVLRKLIDIVAVDRGVDGILVLLAPDPLADMPAVVKQLAQAVTTVRKPIISCFMGDATMRPLRHLLDSAGTPAFRTPESAANAFGVLASYHYNQTLSLQMLPPEPLGKPARLKEASLLIRSARMQGRLSLLPEETARLFSCFHIPIDTFSTVRLEGQAAEAIAMAIRVHRDPELGSYINFGSGGRQAISANDRAVELPPLNGFLARQLVERSAVWRKILSRQLSVVASDALQEAIEKVSDLICELPDVESLVIDPLYATDTQLLARSVKVQLSDVEFTELSGASGYRHLAIHPYPHNLVQNKTFEDGVSWMLRPIRPEDAEALQAFVRDLSDESRYMRFVSMLRELTPRMLARYTRIDYDRELALVATVQLPNPAHRGYMHEQIIGFAHYLRNADGRGAEYALVISDNWQRRKLGKQLMGGLIEAARMQGLSYIDGLVLSSNRAMLALMAHLGFQNDAVPDDPELRRVWLDLGGAQAADRG